MEQHALSYTLGKLVNTGPISPPDQLPSGRMPVWIERSEEVTDVEVLEKVKRDHVKDGERVMVVYEADDETPETREWCRRQKPAWRYVESLNITGSEDQVAVVTSKEPNNEHYSRARNGLVVVSTSLR